MPRALFEKKGNAIWMSHLDLMRLFQRAFKRAGLLLTHSHGFNPRPSVSFALPLSVGIESSCELLDFALENCSFSSDEIKERLNQALVDGVRVVDIYDDGRKIRDLSLLQCQIDLEYEQPVTDDACHAIRALFSGDEVIVPKKTKSGIQDQNIITMIHRLHISRVGDNALRIDALICCQNPTLNPMQIPMAITKYLPEYTPAFTQCRRIEVFDIHNVPFR